LRGIRSYLKMAPLFRRKRRPRPTPIPLEVILMSKPVRSPNIEWEKGEKGEVIVKVKLPPPKPGPFSGFIKRPSERKYVLDEVGSYVWELLDGSRTVGEIVDLVAQRYKLHRREAEASLLAYLRMLAERGLIKLVAPTPPRKKAEGEMQS